MKERRVAMAISVPPTVRDPVASLSILQPQTGYRVLRVRGSQDSSDRDYRT
jgi:hypothetical protein